MRTALLILFIVGCCAVLSYGVTIDARMPAQCIETGAKPVEIMKRAMQPTPLVWPDHWIRDDDLITAYPETFTCELRQTWRMAGKSHPSGWPVLEPGDTFHWECWKK